VLDAAAGSGAVTEGGVRDAADELTSSRGPRAGSSDEWRITSPLHEWCAYRVVNRTCYPAETPAVKVRIATKKAGICWSYTAKVRQMSDDVSDQAFAALPPP
jgi:hypothetical protein